MLVFRSLGVLLAAMLVLSACGVFNKKRQPPCPRISILQDAKRLVTFAPGGGTDLSAMVSEVRLAGVSATCSYGKDEVEIHMALTIAARRGPADRSRKAPAKYFVAIMGPGQNIVAKRVFEVTLAFPVNVDAGGLTDNLVQKIPLGRDERGTGYRIIAGLQLTPGQLKFNRDRAKIKSPGDLRDIPITPPIQSRPPEASDFPPDRQRGGADRTPGQGY
jgi:hypothetical protein